MNNTKRTGSGNETLLTLSGVGRTFTSPAGPFAALADIDLRIGKGEFLAVVGKSGSGKTTLLNLLTGIDRPTAGRIMAGDTALHSLREGKTARWRGRTVGIVFQFFQLLPTLTIAENVMLAMDFCGAIPPRERRRRAAELLALVGLAAHARRLPSCLSGGEQQRAAVARAMANDPPLLVADEPTGNLDSETGAAVFALLKAEAEAGKTVIIVTHDRDLAAQADRTVTLVDGRLAGEV